MLKASKYRYFFNSVLFSYRSKIVAPNRQNMVASDISTNVLKDPRIKLFSKGERENQVHENDDVDSVTEIQGNRDVNN